MLLVPRLAAVRHLALLALAVAPLFGQQAAAGAFRPGLIEVGKVQGSCIISKVDPRDGKPKGQANLTRGMTFTEGHLLRTNGNDSLLELVFSNGATLRLVGQASLEVKTFTQVPSVAVVPGKFREIKEEPSTSIVQIELHYGKMVGEVHKLSAESVFTVKTPVGLTRIRGTIWSDEFRRIPGGNRGEQISICASGQIDVRDLNGSDPATAKQGEKVIVIGSIAAPESQASSNPRPKPGQNVDLAPGDSTTELKQAEPEKLRQLLDLVQSGG